MSQEPSSSSLPAANGGPGRPPGGTRNLLLALRLGVTLLASLGGVVVYIALVGMGASPTLAVVVGLIFALLSRQAASSLVVDALVRRARQAREVRPPADGGAGRPTEPDAPRW